MARIDDFKEAYRLAAQELARLNLHRICSLSGAIPVEDGEGRPSIRIPLMNEDLLVRVEPAVDITRADGGEAPPLAEKIILLHYLLTARGESLTRKLITFREVPGGSFYHPAFLKRARDPLVKVFGPQPEQLLNCGRQLGADPDSMGDVSITLRPLPRIPVTIVLWRGDDEFPPEGSILFDESVGTYLPTEDIAMLSGMIVYRLIRINQRLRQ